MAQLRLNGTATGGKVYEIQLPAGKNLLDVKRQGEKDGLDQVYFQVGDKNYVAEGDGLNLKGLKQGVFQSIELVTRPGTPEERAELGTLRVVDDEVNTAWEGVGQVGKASLALLSGGLIGGGVVAGRATMKIAPVMLDHAGQGMGALQAGMTAVKAGMKPMNEGMALSIGSVQKIIGAPAPNQGLMDKLFDGVGKVTSLPQRTQEITQGLDLIKTGANTAQEGLLKTEEGMAHFTATADLAKSGAQSFRQAAKVAGVGLAVAGTVLVGGAIYGAARGAKDNALGSFKGAELK